MIPLRECTAAKHGQAFLDRKNKPVLIKFCEEPEHEQLLSLYMHKVPRNSFNGLPPLRDEACRRWVENIIAEDSSLVAFAFQGDVMGHAALFHLSGLKCEILIVVAPSFQNRGIGTQLAMHAVELAYEAGYEQVWLSVSVNNSTARHVYTKCGFQYVTASGTDEVEMVLDLSHYRGAVTAPVSTIMNPKVVAVTIKTSCRDAMLLFVRRNIGALPVTDESTGEIAGILTETDFLRGFSPGQKVVDLMTRNVLTVRNDCPVSKVIRLFFTRRIRCIPVVDQNNRLVGVVGRKDIIAHHAKQPVVRDPCPEHQHSTSGSVERAIAG